MTPVMITFMDDEGEETTLGPFSHGVVVESVESVVAGSSHYVKLINVSDSQLIARTGMYGGEGWCIFPANPFAASGKTYGKMFVQAHNPGGIAA